MHHSTTSIACQETRAGSCALLRFEKQMRNLEIKEPFQAQQTPGPAPGLRRHS